MKHSLYVLRHAKSDWDPGVADDHERALASRGVEAARTIGRFAARCDERPQLVLASSAVRALRTAELAAEAGAWESEVRAVPELYEATPASVVGTIRRLGGEARRLCVVGHEPTSSALVGALVGGAAVELPTAALARIDFDLAGWAELDPGRGVLRWLVTPKILA